MRSIWRAGPRSRSCNGSASVAADLSFNDVVNVNGEVRFRVRSHGAHIAQTYGSADCRGKFLDEILPASYLRAALATYHQVVAARLPVYTVADMRDRAGRIV